MSPQRSSLLLIHHPLPSSSSHWAQYLSVISHNLTLSLFADNLILIAASLLQLICMWNKNKLLFIYTSTTRWFSALVDKSEPSRQIRWRSRHLELLWSRMQKCFAAVADDGLQMRNWRLRFCPRKWIEHFYCRWVIIEWLLLFSTVALLDKNHPVDDASFNHEAANNRRMLVHVLITDW